MILSQDCCLWKHWSHGFASFYISRGTMRVGWLVFKLWLQLEIPSIDVRLLIKTYLLWAVSFFLCGTVSLQAYGHKNFDCNLSKWWWARDPLLTLVLFLLLASTTKVMSYANQHICFFSVIHSHHAKRSSKKFKSCFRHHKNYLWYTTAKSS